MFFAFSAFIISGLRRLPPAQAGEAMRAINRTAERAPLGLLILASLGLPIAAAIVGAAQQAEGASYAAAGAVVAVTGILVIALVGNVPLNVKLERAGDPAVAWEHFAPRWLAWNHARTLMAATASALLVLAA